MTPAQALNIFRVFMSGSKSNIFFFRRGCVGKGAKLANGSNCIN